MELLVSTRFAADLAALILVKGTLVLSCAGLACWVLRRRSAAVRHRVWLAAMIALVALPVVHAASPLVLETGLLRYPAETALVGAEAWETAAVAGPSDRVESRAAPDVGPVGFGADPARFIPWFLIAWWVGALALGTRTLVDLGRGLWIRSRSRRPVQGNAALELFETERYRAGLADHVHLLILDAPGFAATFGLVRPVVVIGEDVAAMPANELRTVFLHELAHIRRRDFASHLLGRIASIVYWPNALLWWCRRRWILERERACDDAVLADGVRSSLYARVLLDFEVATPGLSPAMRSSVGFLRFSATKNRLHSILDQKLDRTSAGAALSTLVLGLTLALTASLGSVALFAATPGTGTTPELIDSLDHPDADVRARAARTLSRRAPQQARTELEMLVDDPDDAVRLAAMTGIEGLADPASVAAVARVLERPFDNGQGEHGYVLKLAILALGKMDTSEAADILEQQLDRPVEQLRWLALETLSEMSTHCARAVPHLERFAREDPSERNRRLATAALERMGR